MATSRKQGILGVLGLWPAARTPGPLGYRDQGDPMTCSQLGDTPGPLGLRDWGDPALPRSSRAGAVARSADGMSLSLPLNDAIPETRKGLSRVLTAEQLAKLFPAAGKDYLERVAAEISKDPAAYGLDSVLKRAHFFAQVRQESGQDLQAVTESLQYSPAALKSTFGYYAKHPDEATTDGYVRDSKTHKITTTASQETIANRAYGNRYGNGGPGSGDGWRYRGRGLVQVTFRDNYAAMSRRYATVYGGGTDFVKTPDLVVEFPYSVRSAVCYWLDKGLPTLADKGSTDADVDRITAVVNKNTASYAERREHFKVAYEAFK